MEQSIHSVRSWEVEERIALAFLSLRGGRKHLVSFSYIQKERGEKRISLLCARTHKKLQLERRLGVKKEDVTWIKTLRKK